MLVPALIPLCLSSDAAASLMTGSLPIALLAWASTPAAVLATKG